MPFGTLRPTGRVRKFKIVLTAACMTFTVVTLTGCGLLPFGEKKASPQAPEPPPISSEKSPKMSPYFFSDGTDDEDTGVQQAETTSKPSKKSPYFFSSGDDDGHSAKQHAEAADNSPKDGLEEYEQVPIPPPVIVPMDPIVAAGPLQLGTEGSMGSLGLNLDDYFDRNEDAMTRISKVERAVTAIHQDLKTLAPPIRRLVAVERDIQELVGQLAELAQAPPAQVMPSPAMMPVNAPQSLYATPPPTMQVAPPPTMTAQPSANRISGGYQSPVSSGRVDVQGLRIGEHSDKTRIVLDVNGPATYTYDLDNGENLLVIELPNAGWSGKTQEQPRKSPLVSSYTVYPSNGGSRVVIQLKKGTSIAYESVLKPNGKSFYRIVLDLKK